MTRCQVDGCTAEGTRTVRVDLTRLNLPNTTIAVCEHHWQHGVIDKSAVSVGYELGGDNELRIAELEANRWAGFTLAELELLEGEFTQTRYPDPEVLEPFMKDLEFELARRRRAT